MLPQEQEHLLPIEFPGSSLLAGSPARVELGAANGVITQQHFIRLPEGWEGESRRIRGRDSRALDGEEV